MSKASEPDAELFGFAGAEAKGTDPQIATQHGHSFFWRLQIQGLSPSDAPWETTGRSCAPPPAADSVAFGYRDERLGLYKAHL
ncbi:hypothetical protein AV530_008374 [Patagioenas fasciata monilis]|uniref:Uncharacterized protein n=1 Tax=Patagioenas fasciata monilis TaxID=372326 RepID=A0A1V4JH23_PATFA|nr:hypothetical protein AV530_008374 [Patagioenas fasciata monilis]